MTQQRFVARLCEHCGKPLGTMAFRHFSGGRWKRGYFHPDCFATFKLNAQWIDKGGKT